MMDAWRRLRRRKLHRKLRWIGSLSHRFHGSTLCSYACTLTLTATFSGVQLGEAVGVDEAVNLKVRVPRGIL